jgi:hypothetical protein
MKLLVKDQNVIVDVLRVSTLLHVLGPCIPFISLTLHKYGNADYLSNDELSLISNFCFNLQVMNQPLDTRVKHIATEVSKVAQDVQEPISKLEKYTYQDVKKILDKILAHPQLSKEMFFQPVYGMPMFPQM